MSQTPSEELAQFRDKRVLNLESYKRDGSAARTPVVFAEEGGMLYFQTALKASKAKRLIRNSKVRVAPSSFRGEVKGEWVNGSVARLKGEEAARARKMYIQKLGFIARFFFLFERLRWGEIGFFSVSIENSASKGR
jgi:uncharacterized protein